jgi:hypothetical protein
MQTVNQNVGNKTRDLKQKESPKKETRFVGNDCFDG